MLAEVAKAEKCYPKLDRWRFATTALVDGALQKAARELSVARRAEGLFSVDVLGWEDIQARMINAPDIIADFHPEHADHLPEVVEALRALPSLAAKCADLVHRITAKQRNHPHSHGSAAWETATSAGAISPSEFHTLIEAVDVAAYA